MKSLKLMMQGLKSLSPSYFGVLTLFVFVFSCADKSIIIKETSNNLLEEQGFVFSFDPSVNILNDSLISLFPDYKHIVIVSANTGRVYKKIVLREVIDIDKLNKSTHFLKLLKGEELNPYKIARNEIERDQVIIARSNKRIICDDGFKHLKFFVNILFPYHFKTIFNGKDTDMEIDNTEVYLIDYNLLSNSITSVPFNYSNDSIGLDSSKMCGNVGYGYFFNNDTLVTNWITGGNKEEHVMLKYLIDSTKQYHYIGKKIKFEKPNNMPYSAKTRFANPQYYMDTTLVNDRYGIYNTVTGKNILKKYFTINKEDEFITSFSFVKSNILFISGINDPKAKLKQDISYYLNIIGDEKKIARIPLSGKRKVINAILQQNKLYCVETDEKNYFISVRLINNL